MQFAKDFPDELRSQILTSDVVSKKVSLKQKGREFSGLCPFHNEKTPSFTVNDQKGFYHCFGCGAHGDIISFTINTEGISFKEAVIKLANDHNIAIPVIKKVYSKDEDIRQKKLDRQYGILEKICSFFQKQLHSYEGSKALEYLKKRGLKDVDIAKFSLGFAPNSYDLLHKYLLDQGFSEDEILQSGVVGKNSSAKLFDKFRARVIFPIFAKNSKVIAFGGRILGDGQPKYLNSPETDLFKKGSNLYNYSFARKAIFAEKFAVVVEGYMDVLALSIQGIENCVAPLGTALTNNQITELFRITNDIVIFLDGDKAGINAMNRAIDIALPLINSNKILRFAILPQNLDPDDFIKQYGVNATRELLVNAKTLSQTLFEFEAKALGIDNFTSKIAPEKKAALENILLKRVALINDVNSKKYFTQYYKNLLFEIGRKSFSLSNINNKKLTDKYNIKKDNAHSALQEKQSVFNQGDLYAKSIIALLVRNPKLIDYEDSYCNIRSLEFANKHLSDIKELLVDFFDQDNECKSEDLLAFLKKFSLDKDIIDKISFTASDFEVGKAVLRILVLEYHIFQVSEDIKRSQDKRELIVYKDQLQRKILELKSDLT